MKRRYSDVIKIYENINPSTYYQINKKNIIKLIAFNLTKI